MGSDLRYEYTAMGGAVNLAARLEAAAQPMTILISENTYRFVELTFDCADLGVIDIPGLAEPQRVYQVLASKVAPGEVRGLVMAGLKSPMVGRDAELGALTQLCEAVRAGLGRAVLVVGSYCGATSTTSPPTRFRPRKPRIRAWASRVVNPPTSGVPVPGALLGSRPSTSNEI